MASGGVGATIIMITLYYYAFIHDCDVMCTPNSIITYYIVHAEYHDNIYLSSTTGYAVQLKSNTLFSVYILLYSKRTIII